MANPDVGRKRNISSKPKVKTGCTTCRIRKIKCDEKKPSCQKCVSTGRTCDGYKSTFKLCTSQSIEFTSIKKRKSEYSSNPVPSTLTEITSEDIELLSRCFSTKTIFNVKLGCEEEARQLLQASLTDPSIRHAVSSLIALRQDLEAAEEMSTTLSYDYGLEQYSMALEGLVSNMSCAGFSGMVSALLCCQIFISIEQVQNNYASMAQHIIRGLRIMHECRARPQFTPTKDLLPAYNDQIPLLDVFIIKLFAAPCKFADSPTTPSATGVTPPACPLSALQIPTESRQLRAIAPDMRTELTGIAMLTLDFLDKLSQVKPLEDALQLLAEKAELLRQLESWLIDLERVQARIGSSDNELVSVSFMRMFHSILKTVLLGALESSPDTDNELRTENDRLQNLANTVGERLKAYPMSSVIRNDQTGSPRTR